MKVGDLVRVKVSNDPFHYRPPADSVGIIVEITEYNWVGTCYFVLIDNVGWRFTAEEIEVVENGSR